jgi:hypothetical protein
MFDVEKLKGEAWLGRIAKAIKGMSLSRNTSIGLFILTIHRGGRWYNESPALS